jgi:GT2 family glycosyltransferase
MLEFSQRADVGAVGAKLYYQDNTIQHAGVVIGLGGLAGHSHKHYNKNAQGYFSRLNIIQNLSAVTGACMMVKKSIYKELGGLNEIDLKIAFNDVDFCLRLLKRGYLNIFTPYCEAYHHESISRGLEDNPQKVERFNNEVAYTQTQHHDILEQGDPYYNPNLTLEDESFTV